MFKKLFDIYSDSFDMTEKYRIGDVEYDAYGYCNITNSKYVLVKKAELWRALCFEYAFFKNVGVLTAGDIELFCRQVDDFIEPDLVRRGEKCTPKDHMYSYITAVFICEDGLTDEVARAIRKAKFFKNYMLSIRGYCELRIVAVDMKNETIVGNAAAKDLVKDYKNLLF